VTATLEAALGWMRGPRFARVPMARHTSLRVGGPADLLALPADLDELQALIAWGQTAGVPCTIIGNGTNLVVRSGGIRGLVVSLRLALNHLSPLDWEPWQTVRPGELVRLRVGAGVPLTRLLHLMIRQGLMGLTFAVGIPGTMGGAIVMNAGTEVGSTWDVVERVSLLLPDGRIVERARHEVSAGYRYTELPSRSVVLEAILCTRKGDADQVRAEVRQIYRCRRQSQPLAQPNAGSIFKNPPGERAGRLIDRLGLKGHRVGDAQISPMHANFIVNLGRASPDDVLTLIDEVKRRVYVQTDILLEEEVRIVGE
jgi:UDP-N-acetylmuramate dehydrogenase